VWVVIATDRALHSCAGRAARPARFDLIVGRGLLVARTLCHGGAKLGRATLGCFNDADGSRGYDAPLKTSGHDPGQLGGKFALEPWMTQTQVIPERPSAAREA
jgi:hypothetical protein